jgi:hypothetical protein
LGNETKKLSKSLAEVVVVTAEKVVPVYYFNIKQI